MKEPVVVRFAPSPTGPLHMGGVRTALYNYFFARQQGGKFILRIEDTDQTRYVPGAEAYILDALKWCGIEFDESVEKGGPHAPYRQSERTEIYQKYARELVEKGKAYYAFDTPEEIEEMRERLRAAGHHAPTYNFATRQSMQNSLSLPEEEVKRRLEAGEPYVIRMRVPRKEEIRFFDLVRQYVVVHSSQIDDKVLLKSDGLPTYHLANVVDDHLMEVTHVIRGEEWLPSTPLHVLLYRALGWEDSMPKWVHLPLILKPDPALVIKNKALRRELTDKFTEEFMEKHEEVGADKKSKVHSFFQQTLSDKDGFANRLKEKDKDPDFLKAAKAFLHDAFYGKLSKRDGDRLGFPVFPTDWTDPQSGEKAPGYRETGYLPEAFLNALALLGWNPGDDEELMSMERMIEAFSIERISHSGARFDSDKMKWFNETYIRDQSNAELLPLVKTELEKAGLPTEDEGRLLQVIELLKERVSFLPDFAEMSGYFFADPEHYDENMAKKRWDENSKDYLTDLKQRWSDSAAWEADKLREAFDQLIADGELNKGKVLAPLRLALTGVPSGPGVFEIAEVIGKEASLRRIDQAAERLGGGKKGVEV